MSPNLLASIGNNLINRTLPSTNKHLKTLNNTKQVLSGYASFPKRYYEIFYHMKRQSKIMWQKN